MTRPSRPTLGWLLLLAAAWTWFVWIVRIGNVLDSDRGAGFIAIHAILALVSLGLAVPVAIAGWRLRAGRPA